MKISFVVTGEGTSDLNLVSHLENILIEEGFLEVSGEAFDPSKLPYPIGHSVESKLNYIKRLYPSSDVIFVHRDADGSDHSLREKEIADAKNKSQLPIQVVPIIPVCMLETWLLADTTAIRRVAGNGNSAHLISSIPALSKLESIRNSKEVLQCALCEASQHQGIKLKKFRRDINRLRSQLVLEINGDSNISQLPSYQRLRNSVKSLARDFRENLAQRIR